MNKLPWSRIFKWPRSRDLFDSTGMSDRLRHDLYMVIFAAMFGMAMNIIVSGAAWTGFLRDVVHADDFQLGLISAIPVAANTSQLFISYVLERRRNRRFLFLCFGLLGRFLWIPIGLLPFFIPEAVSGLRAWAVVVLVALIAGGNSFVNLGFNSLMGDIIPLRVRGRYFSVRQRLFMMAGIVTGLAVSWIMDSVGTAGYTIVLVAAGIFGMMDLSFFFFVQWPAMRMPPPEEKQDSFFSMIKTVFKDKSYMMVVLFYTAWNFAIFVAAPFFNVHMLENLHMSYTQITLYNQITSNVIMVIIISRWGRLMDRYGNKPIVQIAALACSFTPILWAFTVPQATWMIILFNLFSGFFWPPIDLGQQNLSLSQAPDKNRSMYLAVFFATVNLVGIALGNAVGGALVKGVYINLEGMKYALLGVTLNRYHYIFITSGILRLLIVAFILPRLREQGAHAVRPVVREIRKNSAEGLRRSMTQAQAYISKKSEGKEKKAWENR